jgi:UDP-N-acetylglucosamine--N-acetylmuramyl-(pentapeptide) pyrophosphoryl-undecaprenol N-acetylglucosamine transferase
VREAYEKLGVKAEVVPFINDMAARYEDCDVVICRAGATSVSELCAAGVASILVPFVAKTTAHQTGNAKYMVERHAAIMVPQPEFTVERMAELISGLTRDHLLELAKNARATARPQAAEAVANLIVETVARRTGAQDAK